MTVLPRLERRTLAVRVADGPPELGRRPGRRSPRRKSRSHAEGEATAHLARRLPPRRPTGAGGSSTPTPRATPPSAGSIAVEGGRLERARGGEELAPWRPGFGRVARLAAARSSAPRCLRHRGAGSPARRGLPAIDPAARRTGRRSATAGSAWRSRLELYDQPVVEPPEDERAERERDAPPRRRRRRRRRRSASRPKNSGSRIALDDRRQWVPVVEDVHEQLPCSSTPGSWSNE